MNEENVEMIEEAEETIQAVKQPEPIGGWLILLGIGLCLTPIFMIISFVNVYLPLIQKIMPRLDMIPTKMIFLIGAEALANLSFIGFSVYLIVLFFPRKKKFITWFTAVRIGMMLFVVIEIILLNSFLGHKQALDDRNQREIFKTFIYSIIWISYLYNSKRVKETMVSK